MREFDVTLRGDNIRRGLRKDFRASRNTFGLVGCQNIVVEEQGLAGYRELSSAVPATWLYGAGIEIAWPEPRIFQGIHQSFITYKDRLFWYNEDSGEPFEIADIKSVDNVSTAYSPIYTNPWELVDLGEAWMFVNGGCAVMYHKFNQMTGGDDVVRGYSGVKVQTGCEFRGRMLLGGFDPENSWHPTWKTFIEAWAQEVVADFSTDIDLGTNFIMWSSVGMDLFWLFYPSTIGLEGPVSGAGYDSDKPWIFEGIARNDMGWIPMRWQGTVLNTRVLGETVMVYGDHGISYLYPSNELNTFGRFDISNLIGINNKGAVGGDDKVQVYLDSQGDLWRIEGNPSGRPKAPELLGYREFFRDNLDSLWTISYSPKEDYFYIANGLETFLLTKWGLSSTKQLVSSVRFRGEKTYCLGAGLTDHSMEYIIDEFDNESNEVETLQWIKLGGNKVDVFDVAIDYKYEDSQDWTRSEFRPVNKNGAVFVGRAGKSFRVVLKAEQGEIGSTNSGYNTTSAVDGSSDPLSWSGEVSSTYPTPESANNRYVKIGSEIMQIYFVVESLINVWYARRAQLGTDISSHGSGVPIKNVDVDTIGRSYIEDVADVNPPDWIKYTFKRTDKRYTRGINISQAERG